MLCIFFFFSSRSRHTRFDCDWSSDVCSSDLARRDAVDSTFYTTASVLRTIEGILGLPPLSQYDAGATPLWNAFTRRPDSTSFVHLPNTWPLHELKIGRASCRERV